MAHREQRQFVEKIKNKFPVYFQDKKVLEVGSLDINGSVRDFFNGCNYIGIDVAPGNKVDVVCEGQNYNAPDNSYDVVCSLECFEHNPFWVETFKNMIRLCKNGGLVLFTCATDGRPEHGTTKTSPHDSPLTNSIGWDYYCNLNENDFRTEINFFDYFEQCEFEVNKNSHDLYFWGIVKKKKIDSIPVIGVPIVNGVKWVKRLIDSIDYPVNDLLIVDNNGRGELEKELEQLKLIKHKFIKNIKICHLPSNIGCAGAWNLIIKCYMNSPYWVIVNHDVAFTPGLLEELVEKSKDEEIGVIKPKTFQYDLFLIKENIIQECGLFDENYYPAYMEDCDYHMRLLNKNVKIGYLETLHIHGDGDYENSGSQTWRTDNSLIEKLYYAHDTNSWYMSEKWGPKWRNLEWQFDPWKHPYDNENIPITYTTYDLKFVRRKYMGF